MPSRSPTCLYHQQVPCLGSRPLKYEGRLLSAGAVGPRQSDLAVTWGATCHAKQHGTGRTATPHQGPCPNSVTPRLQPSQRHPLTTDRAGTLPQNHPRGRAVAWTASGAHHTAAMTPASQKECVSLSPCNAFARGPPAATAQPAEDGSLSAGAHGAVSGDCFAPALGAAAACKQGPATTLMVLSDGLHLSAGAAAVRVGQYPSTPL